MEVEHFLTRPIRQVSTIRLQTSGCLGKRWACVSGLVENATHKTNVPVNYLNSAIRFRHQKFGVDDLLHREYYAVLDTHSNSGPGIKTMSDHLKTHGARTDPEFSTALLAYST